MKPRQRFFRRGQPSAKTGRTTAIRTASSLSLGKGSYDLANGTVHFAHSSSTATTTAESSLSCDSLVSLGNKGTAWSDTSLNETIELWRLESDEIERLVQLGRRLADLSHCHKNHPDEILRFLRAKSGDVAAAEHMVRASFAWRRDACVEAALEHPPPQGLIDAIPGAILQGGDRDGDPVFVSRIGAFDVFGCYKRYGREAIVQHCIWIRELVSRGAWRAQREAEMGRTFKQILIIEDLQGLPLSKIIGSPQLISLYGELMRIDQDNYPDASKKIIILHTPALFRVGWKLFKPLFDKYVVEKMIFCGYNDCEEVLSQYVDLSVLPPDLLPGIGKGEAEVGMPARFDGGNRSSLST